MSSSVIILGAKGRFGRAAQQAFLDAGWEVTAFGRNWTTPVLKGVNQVSGDAFDPDVLSAACTGYDVIINALNPPYPDWAKAIPILTSNVIKAAQQSGATVMIPGNVYNFGNRMPSVLNETTPQIPTDRKGKLRAKMEADFAAAQGFQTIVLRAGDFIDAEQSGNWFDGYIAKKVSKGSVMYPGPTNLPHAWAYLPDMAKAMVGLAEQRAHLQKFDTFGFEGYTLTGHTLMTGIEKVAGRKLKRTGMPWPILRIIGVFSSLIREVYEMQYLWKTAHSIDGSKLEKALPDLEMTPLEQCLKKVVLV